MTELNPTAAIREGEDLDWAALDTYLKTVLPELSGTPAVRQYPSGNSNLTYHLKYAEAELVLRRPPFGTKAKSAHSMQREYQVINALRSAYPAVPEALHYTADETIIGSEFYLMRKAPGSIIRQQIPAEYGWSIDQTRTFCTNFWRKLVQLHQIDYTAVGLQDFGRPEGYIRRQIKGWNQRFNQAQTEDVDAFEDVQQWLSSEQPETECRHAILHGDYRIDNVVLKGENPLEISAVLDWEISAIGDPLMDLGNALAYWVQADDPDYLKALVLQPSMAKGMLKREEILAFYAAETSIDLSDFKFYSVYGYFRNTVIIQQIYYRYFHGQTQDQRFARFGQLAVALGQHCRRLIDA